MYNGGNVPLGFDDAEQFSEFGSAARSGLNDIGVTDVQVFIRGSAVTGIGHIGVPSDQGRVSDIDVAVVSPQLLERARAAGHQLRGGGARTGPSPLPELGALEQELSAMLGRGVTIMIYRAEGDLAARGPYGIVP